MLKILNMFRVLLTPKGLIRHKKNNKLQLKKKKLISITKYYIIM